MKYLFVCLTIVIAMSAWVRPAQASFILHKSNALGLNNGFVGWWTFDGKDMSGVQAYDRSGNGNRGTLMDRPVTTIGKIGQGMKFGAGSSARIHIPDSSTNDYTGGNMTLSIWAYINPSEADRSFLFAKSFNDSGHYNYVFAYNDTGNCSANQFMIELIPGNASRYKLCSSAATKGTWHHVAVTLASDKSVKIYIDGVLNTSGTHTLTTWTPDAGGDLSNGLALGYGYPYSAGTSENTDFGLNGKLDDTRIYNRVLSADEIKRLHNMGR